MFVIVDIKNASYKILSMNSDELARKENLTHLYDTLKSTPAQIFPLNLAVKCYPNAHKDSMF
jgi:hypothetical protein